MKYNVCLNIVTSAMTEVEAGSEEEAKRIATEKIRGYLNKSGAAVFACDDYTKIEVYDWEEINEENK